MGRSALPAVRSDARACIIHSLEKSDIRCLHVRRTDVARYSARDNIVCKLISDDIYDKRENFTADFAENPDTDEWTIVPSNFEEFIRIPSVEPSRTELMRMVEAIERDDCTDIAVGMFIWGNWYYERARFVADEAGRACGIEFL